MLLLCEIVYCDVLGALRVLCAGSLVVQVKQSLAQQYDAGFQPLLKEAESRHEQELQRVVELQKLVDDKGTEV